MTGEIELLVGHDHFQGKGTKNILHYSLPVDKSMLRLAIFDVYLRALVYLRGTSLQKRHRDPLK